MQRQTQRRVAVFAAAAAISRIDSKLNASKRMTREHSACDRHGREFMKLRRL
jgi:hypothetical protein